MLQVNQDYASKLSVAVSAQTGPDKCSSVASLPDSASTECRLKRRPQGMSLSMRSTFETSKIKILYIYIYVCMREMHSTTLPCESLQYLRSLKYNIYLSYLQL